MKLQPAERLSLGADDIEMTHRVTTTFGDSNINWQMKACYAGWHLNLCHKDTARPVDEIAVSKT